MVVSGLPGHELLAAEELPNKPLLAPVGAQVHPERLIAPRPDAGFELLPLRPHGSSLADTGLSEQGQAAKPGYLIEGPQVGVPVVLVRTVRIYQVAAVVQIKAAIPGTPEPRPPVAVRVRCGLVGHQHKIIRAQSPPHAKTRGASGSNCGQVLERSVGTLYDGPKHRIFGEELLLYGEHRLTDAVGNKRYSSKIIKAGALLPDTKSLLETWDTTTDTESNLERVREENLLGKSSRSRVEDVLRVFRQRYLEDPEMLKALVALVKGGMPAESLDRVLYFQAAQSDPLLHDLVTEVLADWSTRSDREVSTREVQNWVNEQVEAGNTEGSWSFEVQRRVVQGLLATLRDFGILEGSVKKRIAYVYLPLDAFAFITFQLVREGRSGERLLNDPEWKLFFLPQGGAERFFLEAHQESLLEYYAAGRVVRIDFPAKDLEEYASVLTQR